MKSNSIKHLYPAIEFSARLYLAYFLIDYGYSKLDGTMFANTTHTILDTPLKNVDLFHLTWYWFQKNVLLSYIVGVFQIVAAILLLFRRTVLLGCLIAFPVLFGILLIDIYCVPAPQLAIRVFFYNMLVVCFCWYRRGQVKAAFKILLKSPNSERTKIKTLIWVAIAVIPTMFIIEVMLTKLGSSIIYLLK